MAVRKNKRPKSSGKSSTTKQGKRLPIVIVAAALSVVAAVLLFSLGKKTEEKMVSLVPAPVVEARSDFEKLVGRWRRPDGGYVIEIRGVRANGEIDAGYFNPRPINVSQAEASHKGNAVKVFIELYDKMYPGSTYDLTYDLQHDVLRGTYFQAALGQAFDVIFVRTR